MNFYNVKSMKKTSLKFQALSLSEKHRQAQHTRKILKDDETVRSMLSIQRMQRLDLIAINNRCLSKYSKIKRAEESNKRYTKQSPFLPNVRRIKLEINLKSPKNKEDIEGKQFTKTKMSASEKLFQELIDEYLQQVKQSKSLETLESRNQIISDACKQIYKKVEARKKKLRLDNVSKRRKTQNTQRSPSNYNHHSRNTVSQYEFEEGMSFLRKSRDYEAKSRKLNQKLFLRKLNMLKKFSKSSNKVLYDSHKSNDI